MSDRFSYDRFNSSSRQDDPDIAWRASESDAEEAAHLADKARRHREINGIPEPKRPVCPGCGSHDVAQISRVTGYLQEVSGYNRAKQQEVKDRTRYNALTGAISH